MARLLIVHASIEGHTRKICQAISQRLQTRGHEVHLDEAASAAQRPAVEPEGVLVAASIHYGRHAPAVQQFVEAQRALLERVPAAFISVSLNAAGKEPAHQEEARKQMEEFLQAINWRPPLTATIAGALAYREYNFLKRWFMRRIAIAKGLSGDTSRDHDYTDWQAVEALADRFSDAVAGAGGRA